MIWQSPIAIVFVHPTQVQPDQSVHIPNLAPPYCFYNQNSVLACWEL
jgi:hypothetical protein